jgi:hypothetical protein
MYGTKKYKKSSNYKSNACLIAVNHVEKSSAYKLYVKLYNDINSLFNPAVIRQKF